MSRAYSVKIYRASSRTHPISLQISPRRIYRASRIQLKSRHARGTVIVNPFPRSANTATILSAGKDSPLKDRPFVKTIPSSLSLSLSSVTLVQNRYPTHERDITRRRREENGGKGGGIRSNLRISRAFVPSPSISGRIEFTHVSLRRLWRCTDDGNLFEAPRQMRERVRNVRMLVTCYRRRTILLIR